MTSNAANEPDGVADSADHQRYADLDIGDGEHVVYDRQNHDAWLQSTVAVSFDDLR